MTLLAFEATCVINAACCVVSSWLRVDLIGTPSFVQIKIPVTPRCDWIRFSVSSASEDALTCACACAFKMKGDGKSKSVRKCSRGHEAGAFGGDQAEDCIVSLAVAAGGSGTRKPGGRRGAGRVAKETTAAYCAYHIIYR